MSYIKSPQDVKLIAEGGQILGEILDALAAKIEPGACAKDIDDLAEKMIRKAGGIPAFKGYKVAPREPAFPSTVCFSLNEEVVHGIAHKDKIVKEGDMVTLDIGMRWPHNKKSPGLFTDTAVSMIVGTPKPKHQALLDDTRIALEHGIDQAIAGNTVADIGRAIEAYLKPKKYGIVRDLCGHGVGHAVHEDPNVLNYYDRHSERWVLEPGVVIAIEPMVSLGTYHIKILDDRWTIVTADKSISCHFEHTVIITDGAPIVATRRPSEKA